MAIVKMRKLSLVAMSYDEDAILNALQRTGAVEVTLHEETDNTAVPDFNTEDLKSRLSGVEAALFALSSQVESYEQDNKLKTGVLKDGFDVTYSEFMSAGKTQEKVAKTIERINELIDKKNELKAELSKISREKQTAEIYKDIQIPFVAFGDTAHVKIRLGTVAANVCEELTATLKERELCGLETLAKTNETALLLTAAHKTVAQETDGVLTAFGFSECPYKGADTGAEIYARLLEKERAVTRDLRANEYAVYELKEEIRPLKIYCDHLAFCLEKEELSEKIRVTKTTFLLQAYVPEYAEEAVREELKNVSEAMYFEFTELSEDETPPTLLRNNKVVENFESITNTYSAPNYREFDPNAVMSFFYSLFMGFIIGDMGYGLLMTLVGGLLWWKNRQRPTGTSRLAGAFAFGGIFAILIGALFNSFFGIAIFGAENTIMPNPQRDMWSLAGIAVPSVLVISMEIGVAQIFVGYICRAVQEWRRGHVLDGIFDGVVWAIFSVGVGLAIVGFLDEANVPILGTVGGITAGGSLLLAMLTAGRKEKFFGKFTKGFGAVYGVINYASDILSYARLYGLMLSGAVIAGIVSDYGIDFVLSGNVGLIVLGIVILVVGHAFNLVMNLLGAYIHDARLQYVEFYGRFFEGEGELFSPLGSKQKYVYLLPATTTT